jgi:quinol monooxygenase YgiN
LIVVFGALRLPPDNLPAAKPHMQAMVEASRGEEGCLQYAYAEDVFEPGLIHVSEQWRDREALKLHFQTPHMTIWRAAFSTLGIADRSLFTVEGGAVEPL